MDHQRKRQTGMAILRYAL